MVERLIAWLRGIPKRLLDWWEKFSKRQKIVIISLAAAVVVAFGILIFALTRPEYVTIYTAETPTEAQSVLDLLTSEGIEYQTDEEGLIIQINKKDYTAANLLLGSNQIATTAMTIDNVTDGGFFTTESDTQKRYKVYLQDFMEREIESMDFVREATVQLDIPEENGTLIAQNKESSVSVMLDLSDICTSDQAAALARFVATAMGNDTTDHITIIDTNGALLYSGTGETNSLSSASSVLALQQEIEQQMRNNVARVLTNTKEFSSIEVAPSVIVNMAEIEKAWHNYKSNTEDDQEAVLANRDTYESNTTGGTSGIPGTDSNTETGYVYEDNEYSSALVREISEDFLPDEYTELQKIAPGAIDYENSSVTVTALTYDMIKEDDVRAKGELEGIDWNLYKLNHEGRTKVETDPDIVAAVSTATGIPTAKITVLHYTEPYFIDHEGLNLSFSNIMQIILIVLIVGLLAFVILRSMKQAKIEEPEPEISIDDILSTPDPIEELEGIGVEDKSEARKIVEKFVEDNPDAAANLLRNWLNEDWN